MVRLIRSVARVLWLVWQPPQEWREKSRTTFFTLCLSVLAVVHSKQLHRSLLMGGGLG